MRQLLAVVWLSVCSYAATYYVSASGGSDSANGTSAATAWKTLPKVNAASFSPGDAVLLARGDVWVEPLVPPSSGASGSPITFDAYGTGAAPEITGKQDLTGWTLYSTNVWSTPLTAGGLSYVAFNTIWGQKQSSTGALAHDRDFMLWNGNLLVWAPSNPASYYGAVSAIVPLGTPASDQGIFVNGKSWLTFQHIKVDWFDQFGVNVAGASDHLVFANMEADGMVPAGTLPHGFYVNANAPSDIQFINTEAHLNYDGYRFDGTLGAASVVNAKAYFNRNYGIDDTTGGHVTYSYSHLYGNGIAVLGSANSMDVNGALELGGAGNGHNVAAYTAPAVNNFARYPARISYTIDDEGKSPGGADYIDSLLPQFTSRNLRLSVAVVAGEQYASGDVARIQGWLNAGHDINSHSWSHNYYDAPTMLTVRYTGTGSAATLSISGNVLTTAVTGGPGGENVSFDLTNANYAQFTNLVSAINARAGYTATLVGLPHGHCTTLANVTGADIKSATYNVALDPTRFVPDEMASSAAWLLANLTGLSSSELVYVYPSGKENYQTQLYAVAAGYKGGRGSLSMGQAIAGTFATNSGPAPLENNARSVYGWGVNVQNITSLGASSFSGMSAAQIGAQVGALVNKAKAWGVPYGLFTHPPETGAPELTVGEIGAVLDGLIAAGATVMTNTQLVDALASQPLIAGSTMVVATASANADLRPKATSASVLKGVNEGAAYGIDLQGVKRPTSGAWDIGAYQTVWTRVGNASGTGSFRMGGNFVAGTAALPQVYVNSHECDPPGGTYDVTKHIPGDYACTNGASCLAAINQALNDWANAPDQWWHVVIAHGTVASGAGDGQTGGVVNVPAKSLAGAMPTKCVVVESDTPLTAGEVPCSHGIQDNLAGMTDVGVRDGSCTLDKASMYAIENTAYNSSVINTGDEDEYGVAPNHFVIRDAELRHAAGVNQSFAAIVNMGNQDTEMEATPLHFGFDRVWLHGDATDAGKGQNQMANAVAVGCRYCWLTNFYISGIYRSSEYHGVNWLNSPGPSKVDHGWVDCCSIGMFFGGSTPSIPNMVSGTDVEIRRVRSSYPPMWLGTSTPGQGGWNYRKNSFEIKEGKRVLVDGNIFENVDLSGGQHGVAAGISARSCSGAACDNYYAETSDVTFTNNIVRNTCNGISGDTRSGGQAAGISPGLPQQRVLIQNNLEYNVSQANPGCAGDGTYFSDRRDTSGYEWEGHLDAPVWIKNHAYSVGDHMRPVVGGTPVGGDFLATVAGTSANSTSTPAIAIQGQGGTFTDGTVTWQDTDTVCNAVRDGAGASATITCPGGVGQNNSAMSTGDPVWVFSCKDATFNVGPYPFVYASNATATSLSVTYPNVGAANASTNGCHLRNNVGWGRYETYRHNTLIADLNAEGPGSSAYYTDNPMWRNWSYVDNIFNGAGPNNLGSGASGEGTAFFTHFADTTTLMFHHNVFADRVAAGWQANHACVAGDAVNASGKNHRYVCTTPGTTGAAEPGWCITPGCSQTDGTAVWTEVSGKFMGASSYTEYSSTGSTTPPVTLYFPMYSYCLGPTPDATCIGFAGGLNASSVLNLADWRNYRLHSASQFHNAASDGADLGANVDQIGAAQTRAGYPGAFAN